MDHRSLKDSVVVVSGAGRAVGPEIAIHVATDGAKQVMADAVRALVNRPAADCTGNFFTDELLLCDDGVADFSGYRLAVREEYLTRNFYVTTTPARAA
ncbi:hypothetical protein MINTM020_01120 [Mycobacterium paraintracellulare]|uniref:hypothetical protein n=1 Tax=Mycobacterium paraintracellulare TaxID=1138383 RepID=UPI0019276163|nr:hypothetical protein [Mycobacterium paraintracellulare]BCP08014.1 hypothetical protein MINTM020_01120 [Mycobacterium paraintracellulare]